MKKLISLFLVFILLVSVASFSFAAVTFGGNLRLWYGYLHNEADNTTSSTGVTTYNDYSYTSFKLDRLALDANATLSPNSGLVGEVQFRSDVTKNEATSWGAGQIDIRVDLGYFYQNNVLTDGGTFLVGALDGQMPFKNPYSNVIFVAGVGDALKVGNTIGAVYQITKPTWDFGVGISNANSGESMNDYPTATGGKEEGYDWSTRFDVKPFAGLNAGIGYAYVLEKTGTTYNYSTGTNSNTATYLNAWDHRMVADISYSNPSAFPLSVKLEYALVKPDSDNTNCVANGETVDLKAVYGELGYTVGSKATFYAGRAVSLSDDKNFYQVFSQAALWSGCQLAVNNNYTVAGVKYLITNSTNLQAEFIAVDDNASYSDKNKEAFGLRYVVNF